jgi:hypothetical protein
MRSLSFCAQFLTGVGLGLGLMVSGLCGCTSLIGFVCRFSSSLPAVEVEGNVGFVRSLHMSVLKMELSSLPFVPLCQVFYLMVAKVKVVSALFAV